MTELKPFTDWLGECRRLGLPPDTPPPGEYQNFDEWYRNSRGADITGQGRLKSYGEWLHQRHKLNLPLETPPPSGYESYDEWYGRIRSLDPATGEPLTRTPLNAPNAPARTATGSSGFLRQALSTAGNIASRLGKIGATMRNGVPVLGAVSTIIHAIREGQDLQNGTRSRGEHEAHLNQTTPGKVAARVAPSKLTIG